MEPLKPNLQRGKLAIALIWINLALYIIMGVSNYFEYALLSAAAQGEPVSMEAAQANDSRQLLISIVALIAIIAAGIAFIMWFRRAYYNLHLRAAELSYTEGWAAGAWFVPFMNLVRPYSIMRELYLETYALLGKNNGEYPAKFTTGFLGWWWFLWIVNSIAGRIEMRMSLRAKTIDELINSAAFGMFSSAIGIPLALLAVKVIQDYMQLELLFAQQDLQPQPQAENEVSPEALPDPV